MKDRTWELMQVHLDAESFSMMSSQDSAPNETKLRKIASGFGCILPDEFVAHSTNKYGGLYVEVKEELWPRPKEFDVGPFWSFLYGLFTYNIADEIPEFMDLARAAHEFQAETELKALPFMKIIGDVNVYCFDSVGQIVRYNHERNELEESEHSFFDFLSYELGALVNRKSKKVAERFN